MKEWPFPVGTYSPDEVQKYVNDEAWQRVRKSLKGLPTPFKLSNLWAYRELCLVNQRLERKHQVQIDNYINALKRGGLLGMDLKVIR